MTSWPGLGVSAEKFFRIVQPINIFPAAAGERFEKRRPADVGKNSFPIERIGEIAKRIVVRVRRHLMRRQQDRFRNGDADLRRERVVEKFLVRAPPKRIVHHGGAGERRVLEPRAIKRHVLRNAIDHHVVTARLALDDFVDPDELGANVVAAGFRIDALNKRRWETVFLAKKNSDFFHNNGVSPPASK